MIALRDSKHPTTPPFLYSRAKIIAFLDGAKKGEFDHLVDLPEAWRGFRGRSAIAHSPPMDHSTWRPTALCLVITTFCVVNSPGTLSTSISPFFADRR